MVAFIPAGERFGLTTLERRFGRLYSLHINRGETDLSFRKSLDEELLQIRDFTLQPFKMGDEGGGRFTHIAGLDAGDELGHSFSRIIKVLGNSLMSGRELFAVHSAAQFRFQ